MTKKFFLLIALIGSLSSYGQAAQVEYEVNRRDFVSLNRDAGEIHLRILYPSSEITQVCGIQLRTNIPHFANTHLDSVIDAIEVVEYGESPSGVHLPAVQSVAEPPYFRVTSDSSFPDIIVKIKTKSGETLRSLIQRVVRPDDAAKIDMPVEVIVIAKHCQDKSN
jgi:hypothetical protein